LNLYSYITGAQATSAAAETDHSWVAGRHLITAMNYLINSWTPLTDAIKQLRKAKHRSFEDILAEIDASFAVTSLKELSGFMARESAYVAFQAPRWAVTYTEVLGDYAVATAQTANAYHTPFLSILTTAVNTGAQFVTHVPDWLFLKEQLEWEEYDFDSTATGVDARLLYQIYTFMSYVNGAEGGWVYDSASFPANLESWFYGGTAALYGHAASTFFHAAIHEVNLLGAALTLDARDAVRPMSNEEDGSLSPLSLPMYADRIIDSETARAKCFMFSKQEDVAQ
jgi:hypothetical protein